MFIEALNRNNMRLERPYRTGPGGKIWIETVHDAIGTLGAIWYNYGVESLEKGKYDDAIEHFTISSKGGLSPRKEGE